MNVSPSKENILKKIREALSEPTPIPFPESEGSSSVFQPLSQDPEIEFAEQFAKLQGRFVYCINRQEMAFQLASLVQKQKWEKIFCVESQLFELMSPPVTRRIVMDNLADCDVAITGCECLVARTGTIIMSAAQESGRTTSVYAPIHVCIAFMNQLLPDLKDALQYVREKYQTDFPSLLTFATGPSRTADIEKTLVVGVHGPKEVYLFLVES